MCYIHVVLYNVSVHFIEKEQAEVWHVLLTVLSELKIICLENNES